MVNLQNMEIDIHTSENIEKEKLITEEKKKLNAIFTAMPIKTKKCVSSLIDNAAFMAASLKELRTIINAKGYTEAYQNGENQKGIKKSAEVDIYNNLSKNYMAIMKQLLDLLPKTEALAAAKNEFDDFVNRREDL